jgi:CDP-diacylglycerol--serine O-phosphatidyltransferase
MITKSIPNVFTVGNLFLGIISIILVFHERPEPAAIMVIIAMVLDGVDGRVARALNVQSEFGKELDSLSDIISFGVAPAFIMYVVAFQTLNPAAAWIVTAVFPICGALRLARYNVIDNGRGHFVGLPIPAAGGLLSTLALFNSEIHVYVMLAASLLLSYLMVSKIKYPNFKKAGMPGLAVWIFIALVIAACVGAIWFPMAWSKWILLPLVLYALYGLKKNVDLALFRRLRRLRRWRAREEPVRSEV